MITPFVDGDHAMWHVYIYIYNYIYIYLQYIRTHGSLAASNSRLSTTACDLGVPTQHLDHTMWNAGAKQSRQSRCQFYVGQRLLWQPHSCAAFCCFNSRRSDCHGGSSSYSNSSQFMAKVPRWTTKMTGYWLRRFTRPYQLRDIHWWIGWEPYTRNAKRGIWSTKATTAFLARNNSPWWKYQNLSRTCLHDICH